MKLLFTVVFLSLQALHVTAAPTAKSNAAFFLAGDSTTARQAASGGGWGNGFLTTLANGSFGINYGHNGATTVSFRAGGDWATVLDSVSKAKASYIPFVTIQFGHNDQKPVQNITLDQYSANLKQMALDVQTAGGTPILVTPLTRRTFLTSPVQVNESLSNETHATLAVAKSNNFYYIDLNKASTAYVNAIGQADAATYNLIPTDFTHLNAAGSVLFGNMVSWLMGDIKKACLDEYTRPNATIVKAIKASKYIFPEGFGTLVDTTAPEGF